VKPARELGRFSIWKGGDETGEVKHRVADSTYRLGRGLPVRLIALGGSSSDFVCVCKPMIGEAAASSR
jgi:hypothetical protein